MLLTETAALTAVLKPYEGMIALHTNSEPTLYIDEQAIPPAAFCPVCHGALYRPSLRCLRCGDEP
jgi:hypothetical protein